MVTTETVAARKARAPQRANARNMRHISTDAERKFWWQVRDRRFGGYKFKRQFLVGRYVVDFICLQAGLVVELDGGQHANQTAYDGIRDSYLKARGFQVLRFWNSEFLTNRDGVLDTVMRELKNPPHPGPLPQLGERE